ncbi:MAG: hypothetical protein DA446_01535 [Bacteroidetes bacterium]|jgi:hypothetical protein|nr:hypothetical protein [Bacteroidota bacterium]PTM16705.1 MAG: hypothetical protein DA443_00260 [Bacteroidota bacterium]PTM20737.1 MAG: hypothetical protein DA446_01535 [Bacteroidota bacterium]
MEQRKYRLDVISFGELPEDQFFCLMDVRLSPEPLDVDRIRLTDPRNFDQKLRDAGCLMMFTGDEVEELAGRGELNRDALEDSLIRLAKSEGML